MSTVQTAVKPSAGLSLKRARPRYGEKAIVGVLALCAGLSVAVTIGILVSLLEPTIEFFGDVSPKEFFTGTEWSPLFSQPKFGVLPLLTGTALTTGMALLVCVPIGLLSAIYLSEYARTRVRKIVKPVLELLAGIPTVVYGFFALTFVTPLLQDIWFFGDPPGVFSAVSAGLVMGVMIIPTVASLSEDAMSAVPQALREGAYGLGSSRMQVATRVVFPAALSGIVASIVLAISRAVGETMIVLIAAGQRPNLTFNPVNDVQSMAAFIGAAGIGDQPTGSLGYKTIFAVGTTLFVLTFIMNLISIRLVRKYRQIYE